MTSNISFRCLRLLLTGGPNQQRPRAAPEGFLGERRVDLHGSLPSDVASRAESRVHQPVPHGLTSEVQEASQ